MGSAERAAMGFVIGLDLDAHFSKVVDVGRPARGREGYRSAAARTRSHQAFERPAVAAFDGDGDGDGERVGVFDAKAARPPSDLHHNLPQACAPGGRSVTSRLLTPEDSRASPPWRGFGFSGLRFGARRDPVADHVFGPTDRALAEQERAGKPTLLHHGVERRSRKTRDVLHRRAAQKAGGGHLVFLSLVDDAQLMQQMPKKKTQLDRPLKED